MKKLLLLLFTCVILLKSYTEETYEDIKIHIVTFGPGDELFYRWGHFGIVVDYPEKRDILYDYGNFSFKTDNFYGNFIKGVLNYSKEWAYADRYYHVYKKFNRTILLQELNLTAKQKKEYIEKLKSEMKPENKYYQYDHYYNNCVSEMVKYLDELTDGQFLANSSNKIGRSFRDLSRDYVSSNYLINIFITLLLGSKVDRNITEKESLFLPDYTSNWANDVYITDYEGNRQPLIKSSTYLNKSVNRDPVIPNAKPRIIESLLIGVLLALSVFVISFNYKLKSILDLIIGIILTFSGTVLFFMAFFTEHYYIHNNWNLLFLSPLSIIIVISAILKLTKNFKSTGINIYNKFIDITLLLTIAIMVLKAVGLITQENGEIIAICLPILIVNSSYKELLNLRWKIY